MYLQVLFLSTTARANVMASLGRNKISVSVALHTNMELYLFMTPYQEEMLGEAMLRKARADGQLKKTPKGTTLLPVEEQTALDASVTAKILNLISLSPRSIPTRTIGILAETNYTTTRRCLKKLQHNGKVSMSILHYTEHWEPTST